VLFVGGTTKMPAVRERVLREFGLKELVAGADPDLLVAKGAALWAQKLIFEEAARTKLCVKSLRDVAWTTVQSRSVITQLASDTSFSQDVIKRLLQTHLESITSRGYAILCYRPAKDEHHLGYIVKAGEPLPLESEPFSFRWNSDIDSWTLDLYEDSADCRNTRDPDIARHVETINGETHRTWKKGSEFFVQVRMSLDQVIQLHAWHKDGDAPGGELHATVDPVASERPTRAEPEKDDEFFEDLLDNLRLRQRLLGLDQGEESAAGNYRMVYGRGSTVEEAKASARHQLNVDETVAVDFELVENELGDPGATGSMQVRARVRT